MTFLNDIQQIPYLGFGIGFKDTWLDPILEHMTATDLSEQVEWLEIIPENYMAKGGRSAYALQALKEAGFAMTSHGVNLSLGSVDDLNPEYIRDLGALFQQVEPVWFSDHISFSSVNHQYFNDLMPLPFSHEAVEVCVQKIKAVKAQFNRPFLIENISYYAQFSHPDGLDEASFLTQILEQADCGLLLDINNVYVNSRNHHYDPIQFLNQLPLERVVEIHLAGHLVGDDLIIDTHGEPVCSGVLDLFAWVYPRCPHLKGVLLERDSNLPPFEELLAELQTIRHRAYESVSFQPVGVRTCV